MMKDYTPYTARQFALDKHFQRWVIAPDEESHRFWEHWLALHPEKKEEVREARAFLRSMPFEHYQLSREEDAAMWSTIRSRVAASEASPRRQANIARFPVRWYRYAAALLLPLLAGLIFYMIYASRETVSTGYGEKQTIALPDGSRVTLNANSTLEYQDHWEEQPVREVWLSGEAFFDVKKVYRNVAGQPVTPVKLVVHTPQVDVQVLGTAFNVKQRRQNTEVVLNSGKIVLRRAHEALTLLPGERVNVSDGSGPMSKDNVAVEAFDAWKADQFVFDKASLTEVADMLRDTYGYEVEIRAPGLRDQRITSTAPVLTSDISTFLAMLEKLYKVQITKRNNVIRIDKHPPAP